MVNKIPVPEFNALRQSLREYLESQDTLKDYNYDGSVLTVLLNILAYNTHINAFYDHMSTNETFLATAQKRDSLQELAQQLNYFSRTMLAAKVLVTMRIETTPSYAPLIVFNNTVFNARQDQNLYTFRTFTDFNATKIDEDLYEVTVEAYEGKRFVHTFQSSEIVDNSVVIPNQNVDFRLLKVKKYFTDAPTVPVSYRMSSNIVNDLEERVYFLEYAEGNLLKVKFIENENVEKIEVEYQTTAGPAANNIKEVALESSIPGAVSVQITSVERSIGGRSQEDLESIRLNAPKKYTSLTNAVTYTDYEQVARSKFPELLNVKSIGGENMTPPAFGATFLFVNGENSLFLTDTVKRSIERELKKNNVTTVRIFVRDPDYVFINYNIKAYTVNAFIEQPEIKSGISNAVIRLNETLTFNKDLRTSTVTNTIVNSNEKITSCEVDVSLTKRLFVKTNVIRAFNIDFSNAVYPETLSSTKFVYREQPNSKIEYVDGAVYVTTLIGGETVLLERIGQFSADNKELILDNFNIDDDNVDTIDPETAVPYIDITADTVRTDIITKPQNILKISTINVIVENEQI